MKDKDRSGIPVSLILQSILKKTTVTNVKTYQEVLHF